MGRAFGRDRAATGFSLDLRELARLVDTPVPHRAIVAPLVVGAAVRFLREEVARLRAAGEIVLDALPGEGRQDWREAGCDRCLEWLDGRWQLVAL